MVEKTINHNLLDLLKRYPYSDPRCRVDPEAMFSVRVGQDNIKDTCTLWEFFHAPRSIDNSLPAFRWRR
jgi:hypothetical protein